MANTTDLVNLISSQIEPAIERSESHNEIVAVNVTLCGDISTVAEIAKFYADNVDYTNEGDGSWDMWGWSDEMEAEGKCEMQWRIRVALAS